MKWLTSPEIMVELCHIYGCIPARKSVQSQVLEQLKSNYPHLDLPVIFKSIEYLDNPNNEAWIPEYGKINDSLDNALSLIYLGKEKNAKKLLTNINGEVQRILDEYSATHQ
jgi:multiple sugar transport system substrate-binding protein